jgi:adenylate cyclase
MSADERATIAALDAARAVFRAQIESHHGRVIDMAGDSVRAVFETATGAVSAALDVQRQLEAMVAGVPADRRMRFRIGVHLGDVIEKADGSVYGDGVNIAARIEGLALPGGVTVSDAVQGAVRHRVAASFEDLGEQEVKNIAEPVRVYRVLASTNGEAPVARSGAAWLTPLAPRRRRLVAGGLVITAAALAAAGWQWRGGARRAVAAPITMSLAFGPIAAPAGDAASAQAAELFAQNLATGLGAVERRVRVVSIAQSASTPATVRERARAAGARYVVEGELQGDSPQHQLSLRIIETGRGTLAWSNRFDVPDAAGSLQFRIALRKIVRELALAVRKVEITRVLATPANELDAMELLVRSWGVLEQGESVAIANEARKMLDEALRLDPTLA